MTKTIRDTALQDRGGVATVQQIVTRDIRWVFREQTTDDFGIDAHLEVVENDGVSGRLIAVQIKSGPSYFSEPHEGGWWFRLDSADLGYWMDHSLPVIVVLCNPDLGIAYWQSVSEKTVVVGSRGGKKILVPTAHRLGRESRRELAKIAEGSPYELRLRALRLALPWMKLLQDGRRILLEADEWINKTSGRGDIVIASVDEDGEDRQELGSWYIRAGLRPYEDLLPTLVPWADLFLHEETYDDADRQEWEESCVFYDGEGDRIVLEDYAEWRERTLGECALRPYINLANEIDRWRLELGLNDLGRSFLAVDRFALGDGAFLSPR
ncbi:DUF4365 domain-containing protein [Flavimobilis sp. GY10621]|uniref:DUF4365 domain-containing protein n=1 Tax=Flavimobilis rhizosphaerae TaxID=2775421 RepID=A0ABR9DR13_9MICO|nr:DUF4365 domain-containing protein [Flavimobilis rhizosphaerae]MBD9699548.1 DUF4365 domain-containing protein [Flavimobilis rhizosphaerae]